ncbi:MAG: preprotein translocase subunit SecE [Bacilli bacterium]
MSELKKDKVVKKQSRLASVFTKEYKHEWLILLILSLIAIVLGVIFLNNEFGLTLEDIYLIGDYPKVFAWILIVLGVLSLLLSVWPYYKPSIDELKRVTWPKRGDLLRKTAVVLLFSVIMALFFAVADLGLNVIENWLGR